MELVKKLNSIADKISILEIECYLKIDSLADDCLKTENFNSKSLSNSLDNICSYFNNSLFSLILEYVQIGKNQENALNFYLEKMQTFKKYSHKIGYSG